MNNMRELKKVYKRIGGLVRIAEKKQTHGGEIDKIVGRQVERNLKMVKRIISEEIVECGCCEYYYELPDAIDCGHISLETASDMLREGTTGYCSLMNIGTFTSGYCHMAEKRR